jgi:tetratricopeptide (TPR) repeat protein
VLDQTVFASSAVAELMSAKFVAVKVNPEKADKKVAEDFGVRGFPTALIIDPETGKELDRIVGAQPVEAYLKTLKEIAAGNSFGALEKKAKASPKDAGLWADYARKLEGRDRLDDAEAAWKKVADLDPEEKGPGVSAQFGLAKIKAMRAQDPNPIYDFAKKYDGKPVALEAHEMITQILGGSPLDDEDQKRLFASYEYLLAHGKRDPETLNNYAYTLAVQGKEPGKALPLAREALKGAPDAPHILDTLAECLWATGEKEEALATERKALEKADPKNKQMVDVFKKKIAEWEGEAKAGKDKKAEKEGDDGEK